MPLPPEELRLYARHIALPEIGEGGQRRIAEARPVFDDHATPGAAAWAADYLARAGFIDVGGEPAPVAIPSPHDIQRIAGTPEFEHAAELLSGAFAAVERIKATVLAGPPSKLPTVRISGEGRCKA